MELETESQKIERQLKIITNLNNILESYSKIRPSSKKVYLLYLALKDVKNTNFPSFTEDLLRDLVKNMTNKSILDHSMDTTEDELLISVAKEYLNIQDNISSSLLNSRLKVDSIKNDYMHDMDIDNLPDNYEMIRRRKALLSGQQQETSRT
jgi:hypothetical protein